MTQPPRTIHYTELPPAPRGNVREVEWETFRRELPRLLAEGHEGKWVLIRGEELVARFDDWHTAHEEGHRRYGPTGFLTPRVSVEQPVRNCRPWWLALSCPYVLRLVAARAGETERPAEGPAGPPTIRCPRWLYFACPTLVIP